MRPSINPQSAKLNNLNNVHPLEVVSRYRTVTHKLKRMKMNEVTIPGKQVMWSTLANTNINSMLV